MYNDSLQKEILDDLDSKAYSIVNTIIALTSQGYLVNKKKDTKLRLTSILIPIFENIGFFDCKQRSNVESMYNKLSTI